MFLIYMDESGNTGANLSDPNQPYHVLVALLVETRKWRDVELDFEEKVKGKLWQAIARRFSRSITLDLERKGRLEVHASQLYQGTRAFEGLGWEVRDEILRAVLALLATHGLPVIWAAIDKQRLARQYPAYGPHELAFLFVAERVERLLRVDYPDQLGIFIADRSPAREGDLKARLKWYRDYGASFGRSERLDHIVETIHFVPSEESYFIQIADCVAYFVNRSLTKGDLRNPYYSAILGSVRDRRVFPD